LKNGTYDKIISDFYIKQMHINVQLFEHGILLVMSNDNIKFKKNPFHCRVVFFYVEILFVVIARNVLKHFNLQLKIN